MTNTRLDRFTDSINGARFGTVDDLLSPDEVSGALQHAGLVLREAADHTVDEARDGPEPSGLWNPMPVSFTIRHTACELALQMSNIADRDADHVLADADKFRAFLVGINHPADGADA